MGKLAASMSEIESQIRRAAGALSCATAIFVTTGNALATESGIPDLRDPEIFGEKFPHLRSRGLSFSDVYSPRMFKRVGDSKLAWGFHAARRATYRFTPPHPSLATLSRWADELPGGAYAFTANVDGQLQRAHFRADRILELQGNAEWLQCVKSCGAPPFPGGLVDVEIDPDTRAAQAPLPKCEACGGLARPNVLLFADEKWEPSRAVEQEESMNAWLAELRAQPKKKLVVIECGVDPSTSAVRAKSERVASAMESTLVRIHPRSAEAPRGQVGIALPIQEAIDRIEVEVRKLR